MACRREERLAVAQPMGDGVDEGLVGDALTVRGLGERLLDQPEDRQERVERRVAIELLGVLDRERAPGLPGELDDGRRADGALDVAVQLDLRDRVEHVRHARHPSRGSGRDGLAHLGAQRHRQSARMWTPARAAATMTGMDHTRQLRRRASVLAVAVALLAWPVASSRAAQLDTNADPLPSATPRAAATR